MQPARELSISLIRLDTVTRSIWDQENAVGVTTPDESVT